MNPVFRFNAVKPKIMVKPEVKIGNVEVEARIDSSKILDSDKDEVQVGEGAKRFKPETPVIVQGALNQMSQALSNKVFEDAANQADMNLLLRSLQMQEKAKDTSTISLGVLSALLAEVAEGNTDVTKLITMLKPIVNVPAPIVNVNTGRASSSADTLPAFGDLKDPEDDVETKVEAEVKEAELENVESIANLLRVSKKVPFAKKSFDEFDPSQIQVLDLQLGKEYKWNGAGNSKKNTEIVNFVYDLYQKGLVPDRYIRDNTLKQLRGDDLIDIIKTVRERFDNWYVDNEETVLKGINPNNAAAADADAGKLLGTGIWKQKDGLLRLKHARGTFYPFGKLVINKESLEGGTIAVGIPSEGRLVKQSGAQYFKNSKVTPAFVNHVHKILKTNTVHDLSDLSIDERDKLYNLISNSKLKVNGANNDKVKHFEKQRKDASRINSMKSRFKLLLGSYQAGNQNNPKLKVEILKIIDRMAAEQLITADQVNQMRVHFSQ